MRHSGLKMQNQVITTISKVGLCRPPPTLGPKSFGGSWRRHRHVMSQAVNASHQDLVRTNSGGASLSDRAPWALDRLLPVADIQKKIVQIEATCADLFSTPFEELLASGRLDFDFNLPRLPVTRSYFPLHAPSRNHGFR